MVLKIRLLFISRLGHVSPATSIDSLEIRGPNVKNGCLDLFNVNLICKGKSLNISVVLYGSTTKVIF
jgi:hypothetical protein